MTRSLWVVVGVVVLLLCSIVRYNRFVRQRTLVDESWGGIDVELSRRHDLIPNLVETVQGYAAHERAVLETLVRAREAATAHRDDRAEAREGFEDTVGRALAGARPRRGLPRPEGEPELPGPPGRADHHRGPDRRRPPLLQRQRPRLQHPRPDLPVNLVAGMFRFRAREFFELGEDARASVPGVDPAG